MNDFIGEKAMKLVNIERKTFEQLDPPRQIIHASYSHRFAIVELETWGQYGLAWRSDLIEPSIQATDSMLWIGVDENIVALSLDQGTIAVALTLHYSLFDIFKLGSAIIIVTELEILVFNENGSLRFTEELPEIAANWSFQDEKMSIELLDQTKLLLDLRSGKILSTIAI